MRSLLITAWLVGVPCGLAAWHWGPGQEGLALDRADDLLREAERLARAGAHAEAAARWEEALRAIPPGEVPARRRARLEKARAELLSGGLWSARVELEALLDEVQADPASEPGLTREVRAALAGSQFYVTWLLKLEGAAREEWEPEIEAARQNYAWLAERAPDGAERTARQGDLEAAVRLGLRDPEELRGLPIPSPCNCSGERPGRSKNSGRGARGQQRDGRGASMGPPADEGGS